jgi:predicted anti-sigma-YlaC factor YlaD
VAKAIDCKRAWANRHEWLDAELDGEEASPAVAAVQAHLKVCPQCAAKFRGFAAFWRALREKYQSLPAGVTTPEARAAFWRRVQGEGGSADAALFPPSARV